MISGKQAFSSAVMVGSKLNAWKIKPMERRRRPVNSASFIAPTGLPKSVISPVVGAVSPAMR